MPTFPRSPRLLAVGGLAALTVAAALGLSGLTFEQPAQSGDLPQARIYETGLAAIRSPLPLAIGSGGAATVNVTLPPGTILETVALHGDGLTLERLRGPGSDLRPPERGDEVGVVTVDGQTFSGTLLDATTGATVRTELGTVFINPMQIVAITRIGDGGAGVGLPVEMTVRGPAGAAAAATLAYLVTGPSWTPAYEVGLDGARPQAPEAVLTALVRGAAGLGPANVELAVGAPRFIGGGFPPPVPFPLLGVAEARLAGGVTLGQAGEVHVFRVAAPVDLGAREVVRVPLWRGPLDVTRAYFEIETHAPSFGGGASEPIPALERYTLRNGGPFPFPGGPVHFYREGAWVGSDVMPFTPRNASVNLTSGTARELVATRTIRAAEGDVRMDNVTESIAVENLRDRPADVRLVVHVPPHAARVTATTPPPTQQLGDALAWDLALPPNTAKEVRYSMTLFVRAGPGFPEPIPGTAPSLPAPP